MSDIKVLDTINKTAIALAICTASLELQAQALEEVVVTAQHREENLQDVPIAITAIGSEDIRTADISDINAISLRTPGFSMGSFNPAQPQLFIRGVGSNADGASEDQSVVVFVDGVYLGRTAGQAFDLYDLERLEVLRGPQGTLYGKNAAGGAINIISQKPGDELTAALELSGGDLGYFGVRGKVSGPLGETASGKLSFTHKERDGYVKSIVADLDDFNDFKSNGIRAQLLLMPSSDIEFLFTADYSDDSRTSPGRNTGNRLLQGQIVQNSPYNPGFYENMLKYEPYAETETYGAALQADWHLESGTLTAITAYRQTDADVLDVSFAVAYEYLGLGSLDNRFDEQGKQFSQELRFAADMGDTLFWQSGVFYLNEDVQRTESNLIVCGLLCKVPPQTPIYLPKSSTEQNNETNSYGIFTQATWNFHERWELTAGARYTYETKDASNIGTADGAFSILESYSVEMDESWKAFTPKLALNYFISEDITGYATISTGFKSGGFQGMAPTKLAASTPFDEENLTNYELGIKGTVLDNSLRFNAVAFFTQYQDLQVLIQTVQSSGLPGPMLTRNAGEAESQGFEMELQWQLHPLLQLAGTYAYLDTRYTKLEGNLRPYEGNHLRNAPENAGSLSLIFDYPLANGYFNARVDYTYKGDAYQDIANQEDAKMAAYHVTNLRVAYGSNSDRWELAAWVKNATDEEYMLHNSTLNPSLAQLTLPAPPRTLGATVTLRY